MAFNEDVLAANHLRLDLKELRKFMVTGAAWITHEVQQAPAIVVALLRRKLMEPEDRHGAGLLNLEGLLALVVVLFAHGAHGPVELAEALQRRAR